MGDSDSCVAVRQSAIIPVCGDVRRNWGSLLEYFPFHSLVDDIFVHLVTFTSSLSHRFVRFIEDLAARDEICRLDVEPSTPELSERAQSCSSDYSTGESSLSSKHLRHRSKLIHCQTRSTDFKEAPNESRNFQIVAARHPLYESYILKGLLLPLHAFEFGWRMMSSSLRHLFVCAKERHNQVRSFVFRLKRSLQGSSKDIGWLERTPGLPPVEDGTARFMEVLHTIRNGEHSLPSSFVYLLVPGLFSNISPLYFVNTKRRFSKMGLASHIAKIHSEASVQKNALVLKHYIEELYWGSGKQVMILGHSKGGVDTAAALSLYWSELKGKVAGLVLVQSPYGGTPMASDLLREGQIADKEARRIAELIVCKLIKGDMTSLQDLTYEKRKDFIMKHRLPTEEIPLVSFHTEVGITPGVFATMSHIAHAEFPRLPIPGFNNGPDEETNVKVPVIIPLSGTLALDALHLWLRYGEKSDGLVTRRDAEVPGSVVVRLGRKLDHAWMVYSPMSNNDVEADSSQMCEALLTLLVELWRKTKGM